MFVHGLFLERLPDGWRRLTKYKTEDPQSALVFQITMDRDAWAEVVDALADKPEQPETSIESESQP